MFDLVITNGTVVLPSGAAPADIAVTGHAIAAIAGPGMLSGTGPKRVLDATGQIVIPGGIDPHIHCSMIMPAPAGASFTSEMPSVVSKACLFGGTTTMCDFVFWQNSGTLHEAVNTRRGQFDSQCYSDYALHLGVESPLPTAILNEIPPLVHAGYPTVKMFTTDITPGRMAHLTKFGDIWEVLQVLAREGGLALIHAEDNDLVMHMYEKLIAEDKAGFEHLAEAHTVMSEELSFNRVIGLAQNVPGAALYMVHTSARTGVEAVTRARAKGFPIYGETLHQYIMFNAEDYKRPNGQIYHTYPSLKYPEDQKALWSGMRSGALQCVATDEVCCPLQVKLLGNRIDDTTGGNSGVEPHIADVYRDGNETRIQCRALRRSGFDQRREDHGALPAQGRSGRRVRRGRRAARSQAEPHHRRISAAFGRLLTLERLAGRGVAEHDHAARQDHGGRRPVQRRSFRWHFHSPQDPRADPKRAGSLSAPAITLNGGFANMLSDGCHDTDDIGTRSETGMKNGRTDGTGGIGHWRSAGDWQGDCNRPGSGGRGPRHQLSGRQAGG
ncbi:hypothetical protein [Rhodopila sp.]|uniref:hypothetical protein n=1 Tax=Rhodopila sp. TaxID=2480087 RepID=UPI003D150247